MASGVEVSAWAARDSSGYLSPYTFSRRATCPGDVKFKILFCGVCHSDLHQIHNDWGTSEYPMVPGHEIVGEVTEVGSDVKAFKVGDIVRVGCMVNSCQICETCTQLLEQYCKKRLIWTYADKDYDGTVTQGGYSTIMVCRQEWAAASTIDYIIDTVAVSHPLDPYLSTLNLDGRLVLVGIPDKPLSIHVLSLIAGRRDVGGSGIGGIKETQAMLDFCGKHNITCTIEKIPISYINTAMERLSKSDVRYHFVIDIANTLESKY